MNRTLLFCLSIAAIVTVSESKPANTVTVATCGNKRTIEMHPRNYLGQVRTNICSTASM